MMWIEDLKRDFDVLDKSIRVQALRENIKELPCNKDGIAELKRLFDRECKLTFDREPNSNYASELVAAKDDIDILAAMKIKTKKAGREILHRAVHKFTVALMNAI